MTSAIQSRSAAESEKGNNELAGDPRGYDLARFTLTDMLRCGRAMRELATASACMEEAAQKITRHLYANLRDRQTGQRSSVLVRFFKTHRYGQLPEELRRQASNGSSNPIDADTVCLTLLATVGENPQWNSRRDSQGHKCIPLVSAAMVHQFPMISQLVQQLGLTISELLKPSAEIITDPERKTFGVFHVERAAGSPYVPAQEDFVKPYQVASVLGFGGIFPDGELFSVIIFSRAPIPVATAEMFETVALELKVGILGQTDKPIFVD